MTFKQRIQSLSSEERRQLSHAFDRGFAQFIEFGNGEFIGVHLTNAPRNLKILEVIGVWSYGNIIR